MNPTNGRRDRSTTGPARCAIFLVALAVTAAHASGCSKAGRSLVNVEVTNDTGMSLDSVKVTASLNNKTVNMIDVAWTSPKVQVGIYLPASVTGVVHVAAEGWSATKGRIAHSEPLESDPSAQVNVTPGQATRVVELTLKPGDSPVGGDGSGGSGAGTGGGGASGGNGGGPATRGSGGAAPGSGGGGTAGTTGGGGSGGTGALGTGGNNVPDAGADSGSIAGSMGRSWSAAEAIENDRTAFDNFPTVAMNASGNAMVVWQRGVAVWARGYDGTKRTWGTARSVVASAAYGNFDIGMDDAGNTMIVWAGDEGEMSQGIWWSRSTNGGASWSAPKRISSGLAYVPTLAVGPNGTALAAWTENPGDNHFTVVSSDFRSDTTDWNATLNTPQPALDLGNRNPRVALDGQGRGFLIWENLATAAESVNSIWVERYDTTWVRTSVMTLDSTAMEAFSPTVALNESGAATATWLQRSPAGTQLWGRRFVANAWLAPEMIAMGGIEDDSAIAIAPTGSSLSTWGQALPTNLNARASRHPTGTSATWEDAQDLETNNLTPPDVQLEYVGPIARMDGEGNAIVVWRKKTGTGRVVPYTARLGATATAWLPTGGVPLHDDGTHAAQVLSLAVSRNGTAIAVWAYGPEYDVWTSIYR